MFPPRYTARQSAVYTEWNLGQSLVKTGNYTDGIEALSRAIALDVNNEFRLIHYERGEAKAAVGDLTGAIRDFETELAHADLPPHSRLAVERALGRAREQQARRG